VAIQFNHTIVPARDAKASATWLSEVLGRDAPTSFGPFWAVALDNGVTLDFQDSNDAIPVEHYAFLVSEQEFDAIFERIRAREFRYWAIQCISGRSRSTTMTAGAVSTGTIRTVTTLKSSHVRTAVAIETELPIWHLSSGRCCDPRARPRLTTAACSDSRERREHDVEADADSLLFARARVDEVLQVGRKHEHRSVLHTHDDLIGILAVSSTTGGRMMPL